ncbi:MAG: imidazoleglycerol-phosphate dehydratase HisB [Gammaproteobacteria bacterium]|nr:imidazoleglycerol-phosphate dehydratase HisB [Gammaproteobacteria bacterium]
MNSVIEVKRETKETSISLALNVEGKQQISINTGLPFFDHMLTQLGLHAGWDMELNAQGDLDVDDHHLIEDIAICLGQALNQAWRSKGQIERYGQRLLPMDATLVLVAVDICGRGYSVTNMPFSREFLGNVATEMWKHFFYTLAINAQISLHIKTEYFDNNHHLIEACFKGLALAFKDAFKKTQLNNSSKGVL